jgi:hypothetical protein
MTLATSHQGQQGVGWVFKISGKGMQSLSQLTKDRKRKVGGLAERYLHHERKLKRWLKTRAQDNAWSARCFGLFTIWTVQRPTRHEWGLSSHANNTDPPNVVWQQGRRSVTLTIMKGVCGIRLYDEEILTSWRHNATLH